MPSKREYLESIAATHVEGWITFGCIPALGFRDSDGYAWVKIDKRAYPAHNYTLRQVVGDPPPDKPEAAHTCRGKDCVNPAHLSWKSKAENQADRLRDGTTYNRANGNGKLSDDDVLEMVKLSEYYSHRQLGEMFGVNHRSVGRAIKKARGSSGL